MRGRVRRRSRAARDAAERRCGSRLRSCVLRGLVSLSEVLQMHSIKKGRRTGDLSLSEPVGEGVGEVREALRLDADVRPWEEEKETATVAIMAGRGRGHVGRRGEDSEQPCGIDPE